MKYALSAALAVSLILSAVPPVVAGGAEDVVRVNCTREIMGSTDVTRNQIKTFTIRQSGSGYVMSGRNDSGQTVTCTADADGNPKWIKVA